MEFSRFRKNPNITAAVRLTVDENNVREVGEKVAKEIAEKVQKGVTGDDRGAGAGGGSSANRQAGGGFRRSLNATLGAAAGAAFSDRFASAEENVARGLQTAAGAGVEAATGSLLAGQAAQAAVARLTAPGMEVMARARESTLQRYEDLAAAGFEISSDDVRRAAAYELERERRREKFRQNASADFADVAREKGVSPFGLDANPLSKLVEIVGRIASMGDKMLGITNQRALTRPDSSARNTD